MSLAAWTWSCLRPYRGRVAILTTIAVTNVALGVLAPWPLKLVVDNVLEGRPLPGALDRIGVALAGDSRAALLVLVVCGGLLLQVLTQTLSMINVQVQVDTGQRLVYALRARLLAHLQALALRHHVVTRTADSVYRLEADAYCVHDLVMSGLLTLFVSVLTLVAMFVVLLQPGCLARAAVAGGRPVALRLSALLLDQDGGPRAAGEGARVEARRSGLRDSVRHQGGQELCPRAARARALRRRRTRDDVGAAALHVAGVGVHVGRGRDHLEWHGRRARRRRAARPPG